MKDVKSQIQEVLPSPERAIEKKTTPTHITVKQWKTKTERKLQKDSKTRIQYFQNTNHKLRTESSVKKRCKTEDHEVT